MRGWTALWRFFCDTFPVSALTTSKSGSQGTLLVTNTSCTQTTFDQRSLGSGTRASRCSMRFWRRFTCVNEMCKLIGWQSLFRNEFREGSKPPSFGFLIRPTLAQFIEFVHLLDKVLSENLNREFFRGQMNKLNELRKRRPDQKAKA